MEQESSQKKHRRNRFRTHVLPRFNSEPASPAYAHPEKNLAYSMEGTKPYHLHNLPTDDHVHQNENTSLTLLRTNPDQPLPTLHLSLRVNGSLPKCSLGASKFWFSPSVYISICFLDTRRTTQKVSIPAGCGGSCQFECRRVPQTPDRVIFSLFFFFSPSHWRRSYHRTSTDTSTPKA